MKYGKKLQELRKKANLTQQELAKIAGISSGQISLLENDERKITQDSFDKVIYALGISEKDFFGSDLSWATIPDRFPRPIPVISWVHAGEFAAASDRWPVGVSGEGDPVFSSKKVGPYAFALWVEGDSMEPRFMRGDRIIVDPEIKCDNESPCVVWVNGDVSLKFFKETESEIILTSMNNKYPETRIKKDSKADFRIIGKVVGMDPKL